MPADSMRESFYKRHNEWCKNRSKMNLPEDDICIDGNCQECFWIWLEKNTYPRDVVDGKMKVIKKRLCGDCLSNSGFMELESKLKSLDKERRDG